MTKLIAIIGKSGVHLKLNCVSRESATGLIVEWINGRISGHRKFLSPPASHPTVYAIAIDEIAAMYIEEENGKCSA